MKSKKRIVVVGMGLFEEQAGGANKYMTDFCKALYKKYRNIEVFVPKIDDNRFNEDNYKFRIIRFNNIKGVKNLIKRKKTIVNKFKNNILNTQQDEIVINSHFAFYTYPLLNLCKKHKIKIITHFHGPWALETKLQYDDIYTKLKCFYAKQIEKKVYNQSKVIITLSEAFKQILIEKYNIDENKIVVIPGATNVNKEVLKLSKDEAKEKLGWNKDEKYILTIRRLVKRMGLDIYLDSLDEINSKKYKFIIGGKGELKEKLEKKAEMIDAYIEFKGYIPDNEIDLYYRAADLYFLPTIDLEGFGLVTIEAMSYGTPVIATKIGGSKEILHSNRGVLVNPNKEEFKKVLGEYINGSIEFPNEEELIEIVQREFNWENVINKFIKLI